MVMNFNEVLNKFEPKSTVDLLIGYDKNSIYSHDFRRNNSLLIVGQTGIGKSVTIKQMILSAIYNQEPKNIQFVVFDPSRTDYLEFENSSYTNENIIYDVDIFKDYLLNLKTQLDDRMKKMKEAGLSDIESYNIFAQKSGLATMPYIITVIDEIADISFEKPEINDIIIAIISKAKTIGIYFIIGTQSVQKNTVTAELKSNIHNRIALKLTSVTESLIAIDEDGAEKLNTSGEMIYKRLENKAIIQNTCLSDEDIAELIE